MAEQLYVNKPGSVIVQMKDGTSRQLLYGDPVPVDEVADHQNPKDWADTQKRKPDADELAIQDAHRRAALSEGGQVNSSSSPVPSNYTDLDEEAASQLVANLGPYPELQAAVIKHELAFGGNRQKVIDAAGDYAKEAAGLLLDAATDAESGNQGEDLIDQEPVIPHPDPYLVQEGHTTPDEEGQLAALQGKSKSSGKSGGSKSSAKQTPDPS